MKVINLIKSFVIHHIRNSLLRMGFVNYYTWKIDGPFNRLMLLDDSEYVCRDKASGYVNTLFNTNSGTITIGNDVLFGHNCMVLTGKHDYLSGDSEMLRNEVPQGRNIVIGDGVWIASGAMILGGVTIGDHSVVMAGAVVTKSVEPYSVVAGIPARVVKKYK
ncbi:MAG: acetyltransferase-like isoleucine patch superfamily enzyme [Psychroserpens sp.]|jgi:acetyltransferase-like isoleucine patch superfamily enzyme